METMGVTPTMPLYSQSNDGMMGGGAWFWIVIILLFGGRGFGFGNGVETGVQNNFIENEFLKRDIFNTNANVSAQGCATQKEVIESRYTTQLGLQGLQASQDACCCATQRAIDSVKAEAYKNTCDILTAIHADGEATRGLIQANTIQDLRDRLAASQRETDIANLALQNNAQTRTIIDSLQPTPKPAYLTCSPYFSYGWNGFGSCGGCGNI